MRSGGNVRTCRRPGVSRLLGLDGPGGREAGEPGKATGSEQQGEFRQIDAEDAEDDGGRKDAWPEGSKAVAANSTSS